MADIVWDRREEYVYLQTEKSKFLEIHKRYKQFLDVVNDVNSDPVDVFIPIDGKRLEELQLIREISKELQKKKEEDINKAKADAEAAEAEAQKIKEATEEQNTEEMTEVDVSQEKTET